MIKEVFVVSTYRPVAVCTTIQSLNDYIISKGKLDMKTGSDEPLNLPFKEFKIYRVHSITNRIGKILKEG